MYEVFDHTADLGLRVRAATLEELFAEAARALFSAIVENVTAVSPIHTENIKLTGDEREFLFFDWLSELLFLFESHRLLLVEFEISLHPDGLIATCRGEPFDPSRHRLEHEVKAITYHGLKVVQDSGGWLAEVIVDI